MTHAVSFWTDPRPPQQPLSARPARWPAVAAAVAALLVLGTQPFAALAAGPGAQPFAATWSVAPHDAGVLARDRAAIAAHTAPAGTALVWVGLTDKGIRSDAAFRHAVDQVEAALAPANRARRLRAGGPWIADYLDIPVPPAYVAAIAATGARVRVVSRWLGAVSVEATAPQLAALAELPSVARLTPVAHGPRPEPPAPALTSAAATAGGAAPATLLDYGPAAAQLAQIQVDQVHDLGYSGAGVIVCMLDTGFFKDHETFDAIHQSGRLLAEWDFINNDGNTQNEGGDASWQHNHGTLTWSALSGESPGELYGPAYGASFVLGKTEDVLDEQPIEEDWYVAGLEWADGLGAQVVSSSLGYLDWYTYEDMDGNTAVTTNGADIAASRNILVVTAAGNEGNGTWHYIIAPADGDSVLAIGAVDSNGDVAGFSSWGPTFDGRTKPEVCARGVDTHCAFPGATNEYGEASGTSLSTPLSGGCAALLMEAHPGWSAMQVREALMMTADNVQAPDDHRGWGIIQLRAALDYNVTAIEPLPAPRRALLLAATPNPLAFGLGGAIAVTVPGTRAQQVEVVLYDVSGRQRAVVHRGRLTAGPHRFPFNARDGAAQRLAAGVYFLRARLESEAAVARLVIAR